MRPIGILGGTFDPVHCGHLRPALELLTDLDLQEVRLVPCRIPPHRPAPIAGAEQRVAMLRVAVAGEPALCVDTRELSRPGPSYTVDTLAALRAELGATPLCLILGADAFAALDTWHRWGALIELAHLVVMRRPGKMRLHSAVREHLHGRYVEHATTLAQRPCGHVLECSVTQLAISATHIRSLLARGKSPRYLLPDSVLELIRRERLYMPVAAPRS
jgi:nicotinate-nucleotide adenylyltransferase